MAVTLTNLTVCPEADGLRLSIEGFVPHEEVPGQNPQSQFDTRQRCLETVRAAFAELIPIPWRSRSHTKIKALSEQPIAAHDRSF